MAAGGSAGYHTRTGPPAAEGNPGRLRRIPALPYAPGGNAAEPPIQTAKAAPSNAGPDSAGAMRGKLRRCIESGLIEPVKLCNYAAAAGLPRIGPRRAASVKKGPSRASTLRARKKGSDKETRLPAAGEPWAKAEKILPPPPPSERRAMPPVRWPTRAFRAASLQGFCRCRLRSGGGGGRRKQQRASPPPSPALRAAPHAAHGSRRIAVHIGRIPARQESSACPNASMTRFAPAWCSRTSSKVTWTYRPCALLFLFSTMILYSHSPNGAP